VTFTGVIPPILTPRLPGGGPDLESLRRLTSHLLEAGVSGIFAAGSSSEAALLDDPSRLAALDAVVEEVASRVPVLFGAIDTGTARVVERARVARAHGADAVVATGPFYVAPHPDEVLRHFEVLRDALDVPVLAYDIPSATHAAIGPATAIRLAREGLVAGLKDSSGDLTATRAVVEGTVDLGFPVLTGSETLTDVSLLTGAAGVVPGLGNVDPRGYVRLTELVAAGDVAGARAEQLRLTRLFAITGVADRSRIGATAAALGGFKAAVVHRGVIAHPDTFEPLGALTDTERKAVGELVDELGVH
jgi:4-hydroxy-tetrahydrodipicolinate synthase